MRAEITQQQYGRDGLRYASNETDEEWALTWLLLSSVKLLMRRLDRTRPSPVAILSLTLSTEVHPMALHVVHREAEASFEGGGA
jgi:hypothetical protein